MNQEKILIVEDDEVVSFILKQILTDLNYSILKIVRDGESAIVEAENDKPDLILMDMSLPVMDGWTATSTIKANPERQHIPIIGLTAHAMSGDRERCLEAGCNEYEIKPVDFNRLLEKINLLLPTI